MRDLKAFIEEDMRKSHIYQPLMIWTLLNSSSRASIKDFAKETAGYEQAMLEYYQERVKAMVGKVLTKNSPSLKEQFKQLKG